MYIKYYINCFSVVFAFLFITQNEQKWMNEFLQKKDDEEDEEFVV